MRRETGDAGVNDVTNGVGDLVGARGDELGDVERVARRQAPHGVGVAVCGKSRDAVARERPDRKSLHGARGREVAEGKLKRVVS